MAVKVTFIDKSGKEASAIFPDFVMAQKYAKCVKNPTLTYIDVSAPPVEVTKCGTPWQENYKRRKAALMAEEDVAARKEAEMCDNILSMLRGEETFDALLGKAFVSSNVGVMEVEVEKVCACGNPCGKKYNICYTCRRYG